MKFDGVALAFIIGSALLGYFGPKLVQFLEQAYKDRRDFKHGYIHASNMELLGMTDESLEQYKKTLLKPNAFDRGFLKYFTETIE